MTVYRLQLGWLEDGRQPLLGLGDVLATRTRVDVELITGDLAQVEISRIGMPKIKP